MTNKVLFFFLAISELITVIVEQNNLQYWLLEGQRELLFWMTAFSCVILILFATVVPIICSWVMSKIKVVFFFVIVTTDSWYNKKKVKIKIF